MYSWQLEAKAGREAIVTRTEQGYYLQSIEGKRIPALFIGRHPAQAINAIKEIK